MKRRKIAAKHHNHTQNKTQKIKKKENHHKKITIKTRKITKKRKIRAIKKKKNTKTQNLTQTTSQEHKVLVFILMHKLITTPINQTKK